MQKINNININNTISWVGGTKLDQVMTGVVIERVRAKSRPKYEGRATVGKTTKKEVSFIARSNKSIYWVDTDQIKLVEKVKRKITRIKSELAAVNTPPKVIHVTIDAKTKKSAGQDEVCVHAGPYVFSGLNTPVIPRPGLPMPLPFRQKFDNLMKYHPNSQHHGKPA